MKKLRLYLDTSVISYLDQQDAPERMEETRQLWEQIKVRRFDVVLSDLTLAEIDDCAPAKSAILRGYLLEINYEEFHKSDETQRLSDLYFERGGLPPKSKDDAMHIA